MENLGVEFDMTREHMNDIPQYAFPQGFGIRNYRPGERHIFARINLGDSGVERYFQDSKAWNDRIFFVTTSEGEEVGTIVAAWKPTPMKGPGTEEGLIDNVFIHPDYRGRGLCEPMMTVAMERIKRSHNCCSVGTSSGRIVAIKVYLDFGFYPNFYPNLPHVRAAWEQVASVLDHPILKACGL